MNALFPVIIAAGLSVAALIWSIVDLTQQQNAEKEFIKRLAESETPDKLTALLLDLDTAKIQQAQELFGKYLASMDINHQKQIAVGLHQASEQGQINYIVKLLEKSIAYCRKQELIHAPHGI